MDRQRTIHDVLLLHVGDVLGKDDSKATRLAHQHNSTITYQSTDHERAQVPVNVAVEEPRTRVVREEPDRDIVASVADAYDVADNWVHKVVRRIASTADHVERMAVNVNGMLLEKDQSNVVRLCRQMPADGILTGPPMAPPGMVNSTLLFGSRP